MSYNVKESGNRIRALRKKHNLTQEQAAAELQISLTAYGKLERGENGASVDLFVEMSQLFGVTLDYLILGKENISQETKCYIHSLAQKLLELEKKL